MFDAVSTGLAAILGAWIFAVPRFRSGYIATTLRTRFSAYLGLALGSKRHIEVIEQSSLKHSRAWNQLMNGTCKEPMQTDR